MLELGPPALGCVVIEPELLELPELPELLEPLPVEPLELLEPLELEESLDDESPLVVVGVAVAVACVSPQAPRKTPIAAAATPARSPCRAERRAAGGRRTPAEIARAGATCRPAVASVISPSGSATQLST